MQFSYHTHPLLDQVSDPVETLTAKYETSFIILVIFPVNSPNVEEKLH